MLKSCFVAKASSWAALTFAGTGVLMLAGCAAHVDTFCAVPCAVNEGVPYYLPKQLAKVTVVEVEPGRHSAILGNAPPVADANQFYAAAPQRNVWKSKTVDIRTTPDGLLSSVYTTSENRNAGIADNIRLNTTFYNKEGLKDELVRNLHYVEDAKVAAVAGREAGVVAFEATFDPSSYGDVERINCSLAKYGMGLEIAGAPDGEQLVKVNDASGVVVRPGTQRPMYVKSKGNGKVIAALGGSSTNQPLFNLPLANGAMARESHNVELREGSITGYYNRQPSEVHGFLQGSREVVEDVASVAAAVIAPVAAALEVERPASSQSSGGEAKAAAGESLGDQAAGSVIDAVAKKKFLFNDKQPTDEQLAEEGSDIDL